MADEPRLRYSVYKIDDIARCRALLESKRYKQVQLDSDYPGWELYLAPPKTHPPKWVTVLSSIVADSSTLSSLSNTTNSFILFILSGDTFFAVCGGLGSFVLQNCIVEDFGLDIVCRVVDSDKIKYKRSKNFSGKAAQEESLYKEYYNYEFDTSNWVKLTKEILGEIKETDLSEFFGLTSNSKHKIRLDGKNSLSINRSISIEDLRTFIEKLVEIETREPKFRIFKGFHEVTDRPTCNELVAILAISLQEEFSSFLQNPADFQETNIGVSYSDMKEFLLCDTFEITLGRNTKELESGLDLMGVFEFLKSSNKRDFHASYLNGINVIGKDGDGNTKIEAPLKSFLYAELIKSNHTYFFIDARWFLVNNDFQTEVDKRLADILQSSAASFTSYTLPSWRTVSDHLEIEDDYISNVCSQTGFHQLHKDHVIIHGGDKCEICDVVDLRNGDTAFVYVKRGLGSALRELLAQARSSAELYVRSSTFKTDSITKIQSKIGGATPSYDPKQILWVLAFTDHSTLRQGTDLSGRLTTIVKTDIIHTFDFLKELDLVKSGLYEIPHT